MSALAQLESEFLRYLLAHGCTPGTRLPPLAEISQEIGVSVGKLREQMEVARSLGLVEARPRRGIECNAYRFLPAIRQSLMFALCLDQNFFRAFSALRVHLESAFWHEAVGQLMPEDHARLHELVNQAWEKLQHERIQIPHQEHRAFHLTIFSRLDNVFVRDLLEAYWDAYEAVDLNTYADYKYLTAVWTYHRRIADAIAQGDVDEAKRLHEEHIQLLMTRGVPLTGEEALAPGNGRTLLSRQPITP
ncbi:MAG: FadR family transcriptional regulator [Caldilineae bacterium]|nr:MAG: FadR family transcriptional regulator [Caldilineae bacterium]